MKFRAEICGSVTIEADNLDEAKELANELSENKWQWDTIEVDEY